MWEIIRFFVSLAILLAVMALFLAFLLGGISLALS